MVPVEKETKPDRTALRSCDRGKRAHSSLPETASGRRACHQSDPSETEPAALTAAVNMLVLLIAKQAFAVSRPTPETKRKS